MSEEELKKLGEMMSELGLKPDLESKESLGLWLASNALEVLNGQQVKEEVKEEPQESAQHTGYFNGMQPEMRPRVSVFSGAVTRESTPYDVWRYEVQCVERDVRYAPEVVMETIRRNVKGEAARVVMHMGPEATSKDVIRKLDSVYGQVASQGSLLSNFHAAVQQEGESVAEWCCRLEALMAPVTLGGKITKEAADEMLRSKLWTGLRSSDLRAATRHKFDQLLEVDDMLVVLRAAEQELGGRRVASRAMIKLEEKPSETSTLETMVRDVQKRLEKMESELEKMKESGNNTAEKRPYQRGQVTCFKCGQPGHIASGCRQQGNDSPPTWEGRQ